MKRSAWRYLWTSEDIRKKLIITILLVGDLPPGSEYSGSWNQPRSDPLHLPEWEGRVRHFSTCWICYQVVPSPTSPSWRWVFIRTSPRKLSSNCWFPSSRHLTAGLKDNPREGRTLMEKWTTMLTIPMAFLSAIGQVNIFNSMVTDRRCS